MKKIIEILAVIVLVIFAVIGLVSLFHKSTPSAGGTSNIGDLIADSITTTTVNGGTGLIYGQTGLIEGGINATNTPASLTLKSSDFTSVSLISVNLTVGAATLTFPATSTLASWIPNVGDTDEFAIQNATSSAFNVTLAAGTGTLLLDASTTKAILPGGIAFLRATRKVNSDIVLEMVPAI